MQSPTDADDHIERRSSDTSIPAMNERRNQLNKKECEGGACRTVLLLCGCRCVSCFGLFGDLVGGSVYAHARAKSRGGAMLHDGVSNFKQGDLHWGAFPI